MSLNLLSGEYGTSVIQRLIKMNVGADPEAVVKFEYSIIKRPSVVRI